MTQSNLQMRIQKEEERSQRTFQRMQIMWVVISLLSLTASSAAMLRAHPNYLYDWHGAVILILMLLFLFIYTKTVLKNRPIWPPSLREALFAWLSLYTLFVLLSVIDANYSFSFYIILGVTFTFFSSRRLIAPIILLFVTLCFFQGLLTPPFSTDKLLALAGEGIGFGASTAICVLLQNLIAERYQRKILLQELAQAHDELKIANERLAESALQEQELAVLRERTRLAREMHDTLGHALVLMSVKLEVLQRLRTRDPERSERELEATKEIVRTSMSELRASIANLRSPTLERQSVCQALSHFAQAMAQRANLHVTYELSEDVEGLPEQVEETLWKVGQEALTNIEKHAQAQNAVLHMCRHDGRVLLRIEDDGVGLPTAYYQQRANGTSIASSPQGHYGICGMIERVKKSGGEMTMRPRVERGTVIEIELPLVETPHSTLTL